MPRQRSRVCLRASERGNASNQHPNFTERKSRRLLSNSKYHAKPRSAPRVWIPRHFGCMQAHGNNPQPQRRPTPIRVRTGIEKLNKLRIEIRKIADAPHGPYPRRSPRLRESKRIESLLLFARSDYPEITSFSLYASNRSDSESAWLSTSCCVDALNAAVGSHHNFPEGPTNKSRP